MRVLGIETSCDETAVAIYSHQQGIVGQIVHSQTETHAQWGGVVPELASRDHSQKLLPLIRELLNKTHLSLNNLDGIAFTQGPGLAGALMIGAMVGRSLAYAANIPAIGVHHLEGHLLAPCLEANPPQFPFLALLISGGHTELIKVTQFGSYEMIGATLDDALGEAFDKTAKLLGLGYPGGAKLAELAATCSQSRFRFPRPMVDRPGLDFSFSGIKTYALTTIQAHPELKAEIASAFEDAVVDTIAIKCRRALAETQYSRLVVAGGVAANLKLRASLKTLCETLKVDLFFPRHEYCTDNGAMIAYAGYLRLAAGERTDLPVEVYPRWPLTEMSARS